MHASLELAFFISSVGVRMQLIKAPLQAAEGIITCSCGLPSSDFPFSNCLACEYVPKKRELSSAIPINEDDAPLYSPLIPSSTSILLVQWKAFLYTFP